jgi:hypothetical protein
MKSKYIGLGIIILAIIGAIFYMRSHQQGVAVTEGGFGAYSYVCVDGTEFKMSPAEDLSSITLVPGSTALFEQTTLSSAASDQGARFEGGGIVFTGAGESVHIVTDRQTLDCNPVLNQDMAPFNWGDAEEGAGAAQDATLAVKENIVGAWRSVQDPRFVREFFEDGNVLDSYDDDPSLRQTWTVFTYEEAAALGLKLTLQAGKVYLAIYEGADPSLVFSIDKLTPETLEMMYLSRGNSLSFRRVQ